MLALPSWNTACKDWARRIIAGESIIPVLPLDHERAAKALRIFRRLRVKDTPGYPTLGEASPKWVFDFVYTIFGARDAATKKQAIKTFLLMISKKNGKSTIAAGVMMTALILNDRADGEFLIIAPTQKIAGNSFGPAMGMVELDPQLSDLFKPNRNYRSIEHKLLNSSLRVVAADADTVSGGKAIATLIDELWLFGKNPRFANILSELEGAQAARPEGFTVMLTTQADEEPTGEFKRILEHMRAVRDGTVVDHTSLPVIYEFPEYLLKDEIWRNDETLWRIPNPSIDGGFFDIDFLRNGLVSKTGTKEAKNIFFAKHFNIQVGLRQRSDGWAGAEFWEANGDPTLTFETLLERCDVVVFGIDGGGLDDLLGLTVIGREKGTGRWLTWSHAWMHPIVFARRQVIASKLQELVDAGEITLVEKPGDDVTAVCDLVMRAEDAGLLADGPAIGVDSVGIGDIVVELTSEDRGLSIERIFAVLQGWRMSGAIKTAERKVAGGEMINAAQALMAWCVGNAKAVARGNATAIDKQISGAAKIDPLMALFNAVTLMVRNPQPKKKPSFQMMFV